MLATCASAGLSACAAAGDEAGPPDTDDAVQAPVPSDDSGAPADAAAPCTTDCEYFPPACSADILCPNGLFDPAKPTGGPDHFDGRTTIHLIRGRSASDVWVLGALGALAHFDGTSWARSELPVVGRGSPQGRKPALDTLWLRDGYEVGFNGISFASQIYSRGLVEPPDAGPDAGDWTNHGPPMLSPAYPFDPETQRITFGWAAPGSESFWLATGPGYENFFKSPSGLVRLRVADPNMFMGEPAAVGAGSFVGLHGASGDDFWAVGVGGAAVHVTGANGGSPTVTPYNTQTRNALHGVWAASETDVWAVGASGTVRHYVGDPHRWESVSNVPTGVHLNAVWGSSASDIWAVGNDAVVLHYDGTRWSRVKIGGLGSRRPDLVTVWTPDPEHVWIGGDGIVLSLGGRP